MIETFRAESPWTGKPWGKEHRIAPSDEVDSVCLAAAQAFEALGGTAGGGSGGCGAWGARVGLLRTAAGELEARRGEIVEAAHHETGLGVARLEAEHARMVCTLRMFAEVILDEVGIGEGVGAWQRPRIEAGGKSGGVEKPELRTRLVPLGPAAVFGASNFPLAYGVAGGDTASALAAGCPVVVKGHPLHPQTGELVAECLTEAVGKSGLPAGMFAYLPCGGKRELEIGGEVVMHPAIAAVGFTGSFKGGMALHRLAQSRAEPVPVFAEMGSVNPVFVLPGAMRTRGVDIARQLFASLTNSNGQMCTCPGLLFAIKGEMSEAMCAELVRLVEASQAQTMLSARIRNGFLERIHDVAQISGVEIAARGRSHEGDGVYQPAMVLRTSGKIVGRFATLREECFGPSTIVAVCENEEELLAMARLMPGSLVGAVFTEPGEGEGIARALLGRVGRLVMNGVTTGVEVAGSMVHGGPYPATNQPTTTAVGARAIERWCRPVCIQNAGRWI